MIIYKITCLQNNKVYIGQTTNSLQTRMLQHMAKSRSDALSSKLYQDAIKYGWNQFTFETIDAASTMSELDMKEQYYIAQYHSDNLEFGYNILSGGHVNPMDNDFVRDKHDVKMKSAEVRAKISKTMQTYVSDKHDEYSARLRAGFAKYQGTDKYRQDCANRHLSDEHKYKLNSAKYKPVYCIDQYGVTINHFICVKDAAIWWQQHGNNATLLRSIMSAIKRSADNNRYVHGLLWKYCV